MSAVEAGRPETVAWFHCYAGIAGDMALGSLIDAGAELDEVLRLLQRLPIGGWSLEVEPVLRCGIAASRAVVTVRDDSVVRTYSHILGILEEARLPDRIRDRSIAAFTALAEAEGRLHRRHPHQVHFHEVGSHDTIVDIVGTATALELLGVDVVTSSPVATGTGVVRTSHGLLPNPAPAVLALLEGAPIFGRPVNVELTTPTGAAILASLASSFGPIPAMQVIGTGYGAGSRELDGLPNCTQVVIGTRTHHPADGREPASGQPVTLLETNIDDVTGEVLAHTLALLVDAGAHDAWVTSALMKKGRPGHVLSVLVDAALAPAMRAIVAEETGSLGIRLSEIERWTSTRSIDEVTVEGLPIRVKVSPGRVKPEHADVAVVARRLRVPLREAAARAEEAWRMQGTVEHPAEGRSAVTPSPSPSGTGPPATVLGLPTDRGRRRQPVTRQPDGEGH